MALGTGQRGDGQQPAEPYGEIGRQGGPGAPEGGQKEAGGPGSAAASRGRGAAGGGDEGVGGRGGGQRLVLLVVGRDYPATFARPCRAAERADRPPYEIHPYGGR
ncbi:hypothetical protein GCM10010387_08890 [Streptomyces inusitatus]|uniref:Uncharacterized protein n=1 Tax=Streptomyces inusitatus TaxID=68221 RepID=A0A918UL74_9ACTN|nr:hypothetical protein GCM10010387_08890 [Streptomyces inusitatus]